MIAVEQEARIVPATPAAETASHGGLERALSWTAVLLYGGGMFAAFMSGLVLAEDWKTALMFVPHGLAAALFGAGAMGFALMAPDPYLSEHGKPPAKLPDFS
jgi:hypothetical protein